MKISILGAGDVSKISRYTNLSEENVQQLKTEIAKFLVEEEHEIVIIPNRGIPLEIAKLYKQLGGKKVLGVIPTKDKDYGLDHIKEFLGMVDEKIPVDSWYDADGKVASFGDICLVIGLSPGVLRAMGALKFHYKYRNCKTELVVFENAITSLPPEITEELQIRYINNINMLKTTKI